jgi:hypothetical protein
VGLGLLLGLGANFALLRLLAGVRPNHQSICDALGLAKIQDAPDDVSVLTVTRRA